MKDSWKNWKMSKRYCNLEICCGKINLYGKEIFKNIRDIYASAKGHHAIFITDEKYAI